MVNFANIRAKMVQIQGFRGDQAKAAAGLQRAQNRLWRTKPPPTFQCVIKEITSFECHKGISSHFL